jgi:hypothetical protein
MFPVVNGFDWVRVCLIGNFCVYRKLLAGVVADLLRIGDVLLSLFGFGGSMWLVCFNVNGTQSIHVQEISR